MQAVAPTSPVFKRDQLPLFTVEYWNTAFTPLVNEVASNGIIFALREPRHSDNQFSMLADLQAASGLSGATSAFNNATATTIVSDGRLPNLIGYWAGGTPGHHGATRVRRVAYHFEMYVRAASARDWFDGNNSFTATLACAGQGYFRVFKGGTELINATLTEQQYLLPNDAGGPTVSTAQTFTTGDKLDIFYVQDGQTWGGFVFKLIPGTVASDLKVRQAAMRAAPVICCGLMDDNTPPAKEILELIQDPVEINYTIGQPCKATFRVPLINENVYDGVGWTWVRTGGDKGGYLQFDGFTQDVGDAVISKQVQVKRQRMMRVNTGFVGPDGQPELYPSFTGFVDDFSDPSSGGVGVSVLGLEQRVADQYVKNYPDKISYMCYGFNRVRGTSEPVYDTGAYDNWPLLYAVRDLLIRAGVDESRTRAFLKIPLADGTYAQATL